MRGWLWAVGVVLAVSTSCGRFSMERSSQVAIETKSGQTVYLKRLGRGVTYDVLWLSAKEGQCRTPSDDHDVVFPVGQAGMPLSYALPPDGSLTLFLGGRVDVPRGFPVHIQQEVIHPLDWSRVQAGQREGRVLSADLKFPKEDACFFRW